MRRSAGSARPRAAASRARSQEAVPQGMKLAAAVLLLLAQGRGTGTESLAGRPEWTAAGIMRDALEGSVGTRLCRFELWNVSHTNGGWVPTVTSLAAAQPVGTPAARNQALARWRAIPRYIATETANQ